MRCGCVYLRRRDHRGIRYAIGIGRPATAFTVWQCAAGNIAWRQRHRESNAELAIFIANIFQVFDFDDHALARGDIRHAGGEEIGPLLLNQAGFLAAFFAAS